VAARAAGVPGVTMMDYEHQPANHLSFRLARRVIVPRVFPEAALRRFGAPPRKVVRYEGFKEQLYLSGFRPDRSVLDELGLDRARVIAVFRPPPEGALYHRMANERFEKLLRLAIAREDVDVVLLPREAEQRWRYGALSGVRIPERAVDGASLLALADLVVGAGGTMNRESALLGTPTYTVFAGPLAAVDAELMRKGLLHDLRQTAELPTLEKKSTQTAPSPGASEPIMGAVLGALAAASGGRGRRRSGSRGP
jgi:predicted glycosyltransferase